LNQLIPKNKVKVIKSFFLPAMNVEKIYKVVS